VRNDQERHPLKQHNFVRLANLGKVVQMTLQKLNIGDQGVDNRRPGLLEMFEVQNNRILQVAISMHNNESMLDYKDDDELDKQTVLQQDTNKYWKRSW